MTWHEVAILAFIMKNLDVIELVDPSIFEDEKSKEIFSMIKDYNSKGEILTTKEMATVLDKDFDKHLRRLRDYLREPPEKDFILRILGNKIVKKSILEIVPELSKLELRDYAPIKDAITAAESLGSGVKGFTFGDFIRDLRSSAGEQKESPCFLKGVYLYPAEIGIIEALPKAGKTTSLVNIGVINIIHGQLVYHWSAEINKTQVFHRYAARLVGNKYEVEKADKRIKLFGGGLVVRDDPYASIRDIRKWVIKGKPDVLIIDYADLIMPPTKMKEKRFELKDIFLGLRNIGKETNVPIWTASQSISKAEKKIKSGGLIGMADLEEAKIVKAGIASLVISLNQTDEELEDKMGRFFIVLSTHGFKGVRRCEIDTKNQLIKEMVRNEDIQKHTRNAE